MDREETIAYLREAIESFQRDPASNAYQRGYLSALEETLRMITLYEGDED